jgi:quercetin dioxygenase-like cupin family protein
MPGAAVNDARAARFAYDSSPDAEVLMSASQAGAARVKRADEVERTKIAAGKDAEVQVLVGPADGAPNFALRRFIMGAGGGMPLHTNLVEHEQYVLTGRARIRIGDDVHEVAAGNTLYIPAGVPHSYEVVDGPFEFLCIVPNVPDRIDIVEPSC